MSNATLTGKKTSTALNNKSVNDFLTSHGKPCLTTVNVLAYSKVIIDHEVIQSRSMSRATRNNSYTVAYMYKGSLCYGLVEKLICTQGCNLALIKQLMLTDKPLLQCDDSSVSAKLLDGFIFVKELDVLLSK